jgi:DNA polymerase I
MIMTYVITKKGTSISDKARIMEDVKEGDYDQDYYLDNQVIPAVARIRELLGYTEDELKGKQKTLWDY